MKKLLLAVVAVLFTFAAQAQWTSDYWELPEIPWGGESIGINFIHAVDNNTVWVIGYDGSGTGGTINKVAVTTDGGLNWTVSEVIGGTTYGLGNICGLDGETAFVTVYNGAGNQDMTCGVYKTTDGGSSWTQLPGALQGSDPGVFANNVWFWDADNGFCHGDVTDANKFLIYNTTDGGTTWNEVTDLPDVDAGETGAWTSVMDATASSAAFGTNKGNIYLTHDMGQTWTVHATGLTDVNQISLSPWGTYIAYTATDNGITTPHISTDMGENWNSLDPTGALLYGSGLTSVPGSPQTWVSTGAATNFSGASVSEDDGQSWTDFGVEVPDVGGYYQYLAVDFYANNWGFSGYFDGIWRWNTTVEDMDAPTISGVELIDLDAGILCVQFNEALDVTTAGDAANYMLAEATSKEVTVEAAMVNPDDPTRVRLTTTGLADATPYTLTVENVTDVAGNTVEAGTEITFNTSGVEGVALQNVVIRPNPVVGSLTIENLNDVQRIVVTNMVGQEIMVVEDLGQNATVDFSALQSGVYFVTLQGENVQRTEKIVKQ